MLVHVSSALEELIHHGFDELRVQWVSRAFTATVHVFFEIGAEVFKDQVEARLAILIQMLHTQQPARVERGWKVSKNGDI